MRASLPEHEQQDGHSAPLPADGAGCFPRRLRLLSAADFKQVFADACKAGNAHFTILARSNDLGYPRLGMAISRKSVRHAVARNRIKRQLREYFRLHQHELDSLDLVILAKPAAAQLDRAQLHKTIGHCFRMLSKRCVMAGPDGPAALAIHPLPG